MLTLRNHLFMLLTLALLLCGCQQSPQIDDSSTFIETKEEIVMTLKMAIDNEPVDVTWEDNESVTALQELAKDTLTIKSSQYGGFEQVGSIGSTLPRNDQQTSTDPGDIVLYSGDQMVVFFGTNSWAYTRLGHINNKTDKELTKLLKKKSVTITLTYA